MALQMSLSCFADRDYQLAFRSAFLTIFGQNFDLWPFDVKIKPVPGCTEIENLARKYLETICKISCSKTFETHARSEERPENTGYCFQCFST